MSWHSPHRGRAREGQGPALGQACNVGAGGSRMRTDIDEASNGALSGGGASHRRAQPEPTWSSGESFKSHAGRRPSTLR